MDANQAMLGMAISVGEHPAIIQENCSPATTAPWSSSSAIIFRSNGKGRNQFIDANKGYSPEGPGSRIPAAAGSSLPPIGSRLSKPVLLFQVWNEALADGYHD
jgi:hypothetical protein